MSKGTEGHFDTLPIGRLGPVSYTHLAACDRHSCNGSFIGQLSHFVVVTACKNNSQCSHITHRPFLQLLRRTEVCHPGNPQGKFRRDVYKRQVL